MSFTLQWRSKFVSVFRGTLLLHYRQQGTLALPPVILLHGLFGDLDNLGNLARELATSHQVIQVDLPNHGGSPHSAEMSWPQMCTELLALLDQHGWQQVCLIGHSLGGKLAMQFALRYPHRVTQLVVVDIAPVTYSPRHNQVIAALQAVAKGVDISRKEAEAIMVPWLTEPGVRQFLLKSYQPMQGWRFNLPALVDNYPALMAWDLVSGHFDGPTLFIKGGLSDYLLAEHQAGILQLFPAAKARIIPDAGHWLHAEKPLLFNKLVVDFLSISR
jgi:esterase